MLAALTLSAVIIWKVLNNIIDNDNANDDEQVEAGMSDAADVMRDLLRKGLQVNSAIRIMLDKKSRGRLSEQQNRQQQKPHFCRHCLESLVRSVNILITFFFHQADLFVPRAELLLTEEEVSLSDSNSPGKVRLPGW